MENELRTNIERMKIKAEDFSKGNIKAFIEDTNHTYYFCYILDVEDILIHIENFTGTREGQKEKIFWADVLKIEEYKKREEK